MDNVTFFDTVNPITQETETHAIIDHGNEQFTSMLKSTYDAMQAEQSTPIVIDETKTK
jgi:hypothetical protein